MDFSPFLWGVTFWGRNFGEKNLRKVVPLFFEPNFWGKKFATNCPAYIAKKPGGLAGEGVQGRVWGSTWGDLPG